MNTNDNGLEIVTTPTLDWLVEHAKDCRVRLLIGCPYVSNAIIGLTQEVC
jgi:hypothetical protein